VFGLSRKRYRVVLRGSGLFIPVEDATPPIVGFRATRFVRAVSPEQASAIALTRVRGEWFNSPYCTADRTGCPAITIEQVEHIRNPFRRSRPNRGYQFFHQDPSQGDLPLL
jgi:hypothetical protein